ELKRKRDIRSIGFIVVSLTRKAEHGDATWAYDVPRKDLDAVHNWALKAVATLEGFNYGIELHADELTWVGALIELKHLIQKHTRGAVVDAINYATSNKLMQDEGEVICGWIWFERYIEVAKTAKAAAAAKARLPVAPPQPVQRVRQGAGWEDDVAAACQW